MTNAQAALIAAATFLQGNGKAEAVHVEAMAARFTEWLVVEDEGAQEATSAPQAASDVVLCSTCARAIIPSQMRAGEWRDRTGMWGTATHSHRP